MNPIEKARPPSGFDPVACSTKSRPRTPVPTSMPPTAPVARSAGKRRDSRRRPWSIASASVSSTSVSATLLSSAGSAPTPGRSSSAPWLSRVSCSVCVTSTASPARGTGTRALVAQEGRDRAAERLWLVHPGEVPGAGDHRDPRLRQQLGAPLGDDDTGHRVKLAHNDEHRGGDVLQRRKRRGGVVVGPRNVSGSGPQRDLLVGARGVCLCALVP